MTSCKDRRVLESFCAVRAEPVPTGLSVADGSAPDQSSYIKFRSDRTGHEVSRYYSSPRNDPPTRQFLLVAALLVALCNTDLSAAPLSDAEIAAMLAAHNAVRQRVAQAESLRLGGTVSIPDLTGNPSVAAIAQAHADSLINNNPPKGEHRTDEELQQLGLGENWYLAWSTGTPDQSASVAVDSWASEAQWYNYDENTCAAPPNKTCGHYTQLGWSSTQRLGVGRAVRTTNDGRTYVIWVCNYAPPGNTTGQKPYSVTHGDGEPGGQAEGSHTTRHFVEVRFTKMRVHDCNEVGKCDWRRFSFASKLPLLLMLILKRTNIR